MDKTNLKLKKTFYHKKYLKGKFILKKFSLQKIDKLLKIFYSESILF